MHVQIGTLCEYTQFMYSIFFTIPIISRRTKPTRQTGDIEKYDKNEPGLDYIDDDSSFSEDS